MVPASPVSTVIVNVRSWTRHGDAQSRLGQQVHFVVQATVAATRAGCLEPEFAARDLAVHRVAAKFRHNLPLVEGQLGKSLKPQTMRR